MGSWEGFEAKDAMPMKAGLGFREKERLLGLNSDRILRIPLLLQHETLNETGNFVGGSIQGVVPRITVTFISTTQACRGCCCTKTERDPRSVVKNGGSPRCARRASIDHQLDGVDVGGVI